MDELRQQQLGEEHPDTIRSLVDLAATYRKLGRHSEAEALEVKASELQEQLVDKNFDSIQSTFATDRVACAAQMPEIDELRTEIIDEVDGRGDLILKTRLLASFSQCSRSPRAWRRRMEMRVTVRMIRKQDNQIIKQSTEKLGDRGNTKSIPSSVTTQVPKGKGLSSNTDDGERREARSGSALESNMPMQTM
jgi:hypothetical protein